MKSFTDSKTKSFVLDTGVCIYDPLSLVSLHFDNHVYVPLAVVEELDKIKTKDSVRAQSAYDAIEILEIARELGAIQKSGVSVKSVYLKVNERYLGRGLQLPSMPEERAGGAFHFLADQPLDLKKFPVLLNPSGSRSGRNVNDDRIIAAALFLRERGDNVVLITKDPTMRIYAEMCGLTVQDLIKDSPKLNITERYKGYRILVDVPPNADEVICSGKHPELIDPTPNEFAVIERESGYTIYQYKKGKWSRIDKNPTPLAGQNPKQVKGKPVLEQLLAFHLLNDASLKCVCFSGVPGTGKSFLSLAKCMEEIEKKPLIIFRPLSSASEEEIGFLPGNLDEKLAPWFKPISESINSILTDHKGGRFSQDPAQYLVENELVSYASLLHIRGSTLSNKNVLLDEAQDCTSYTMRLFATRIGENCRLFVTGDLYQASQQHRTSPFNNGFGYLIERMRGSELFAHLHFSHAVRSEFAKEVAERLRVA